MCDREITPAAPELLRQLVPSGRLTPRDQELLLALAERPLTTAELVVTRFFGNHIYARQRLRCLAERQLVHRKGRQWLLLDLGRQVVSALAEGSTESP